MKQKARDIMIINLNAIADSFRVSLFVDLNGGKGPEDFGTQWRGAFGTFVISLIYITVIGWNGEFEKKNSAGYEGVRGVVCEV